MIDSEYDIVIIGAGPAGMAAACEACQQGAKVAVFDSQARAGGQIYRNIDQTSASVASILGKDYQYGKALVEKFSNEGGHFFSSASVWYLDEKQQIGVTSSGKSYFVKAKKLILATGALERPMPIPGWQLPGVMTAGAAQILLKSGAVVPDGRIVLAGSGPLLLLLAHQYLLAGVNIAAIVDTTPKGVTGRSLRHFLKALAGYDYLFKGVKLLWSIYRARVPFYRHAQGLVALGDEKLDAIKFSMGGSSAKETTLKIDTLFLHQGVISNNRLPLAAGASVSWSATQCQWVVDTDIWGQSNSANTYVVGDCGKIIGARASEYQGQLAALHALQQLGKITEKELHQRAKAPAKAYARHIAVRPFLDDYYMPAKEYQVPADGTVVCRCEEVTAKQIREAVTIGCTGPNQVKSFTRCGMGPCQGGQCSSTLSLIIADALGKPVDEVGYLRVRPPLSPITLGQLAES
jgi:NADPH-dependent 2,4-dienoyl-CoA reductase/sulfur reductase-like enzyme